MELAHLYNSGAKPNAEDRKVEFLSKANFNASPLNYSFWIQEIKGRTLISYKNI